MRQPRDAQVATLEQDIPNAGNVNAGPHPRGVEWGETVTMLRGGQRAPRLGDRMPYLLAHRETNGESGPQGEPAGTVRQRASLGG